MAGNISYIYDRKHRLHFTVPSCCHSKTNQVALALSIAIQERWTPPTKKTLMSKIPLTNYCLSPPDSRGSLEDELWLDT